MNNSNPPGKAVWLLFFLFFFSSCASYQLQISKEHKAPVMEEVSPEEIAHTFYLIGGSGEAQYEAETLQLLKKKLEEASENSSVLFLGNQVGPAGMPPTGSGNKRYRTEEQLMWQLEVLHGYEGGIYFVPGHYDYARYKTRGINDQQKFIEAYLNRDEEDEDDWDDFFFPDDGCGGPEVEEISDDLVLIFVNSQWWLADWDSDPLINYGCDAKTRDHFIFLFEELVRKHRTKNVIVVSHHPFYSYGPHGGNYALKEHLFPLTALNENLYLPLPVFGSAVAFLRSAAGARQDISNPVYRDMRERMIGGARKNGRFIFVSGHEKSLQYIERDSQFFIISGSGGKTTPVRLGKGADFVYGQKGITQLDVAKDGRVWVRFHAIEEDGVAKEPVFQKKVRDRLPIPAKEEKLEPLERYELEQDSVISTITKHKVGNPGFFGRLFLGNLHRELYQKNYKFPTLNLSAFRGGLTPVKLGGGGQTNSIRFEDPDGYEFVLRAATKDVSRFIPYPFNQMTAVKEIVAETFYSAHPFAAVGLPVMADACGIYYTRPKLYYVPRQKGFREYGIYFGDEVFLVEERPEESGKKDKALPLFDKADKMMSTLDVIDKLHNDYDHIIDQGWVARSRLFDFVIGDWDRHDDQWRWARFKDEDDIKTYRPVPRDRDQAFCRYDGFVAGFARLTMPFLRQLRTYKKKIGNIKWVTYNGRWFDRKFLNEITWEEWQEEVRTIQKALTEEVIQESFRAWPPEAYEASAEETMDILRYRRDDLMNIARKQYESLAREVDVVGTDERDLFEVERLNDREVKVQMFSLSKKKGKKKDKVYERIFFCDETREIRLFGLKGDDRFEIEGKVNRSILIRAIGGLGEDELIDESKVSGWGKKTQYYDSLGDNKLEGGKETADKRSRFAEYNQYHRRDYYYEYDFLMTLPVVGFNPDDQLFLGAELTYTNYQFKKAPYGQQHKLFGQFAFATDAYELRYNGEFIHAIGRWDGLFGMAFQGPKFVINYFGYGNESENTADDFDFNRVRQSLYRLAPGLQRRFAGDRGRIFFGLGMEQTEVEATEGRFIVSDGAGLPGRVFIPVYYADAHFGFSYKNIDSPTLPRRGIAFETGLGWKTNLEARERNFGNLKASFSFYQGFFRQGWLVLASRAGIRYNTGRLGDFEFFQANTLGGLDNLRGYRSQRFYGKTAFYHNTDVRIRLFNSANNFLPFSAGIMGGIDYGRVWESDDDSDRLHSSYGGGLWVAPIDFFVLLADYFASGEDDRRFSVRLGFFF